MFKIMLSKNFLTMSLAIAMTAGLVAFAGAQEKKIPAQAQTEAANSPSAEDLYKIQADEIIQGDKNAKVTVIEYASLTCSHCSDFHKSTYPQVKEKYLDTGKVRMVFRNFPLDEPALRGAMLASCGGADKFYKFTDVMFTTQPNWAFSKNYLEILANIAKLGGLSGAQFDKCMADTALEKKIMQTKLDASKVLQVRATPTFFINGTIYKGAHNFEFFSKVLDEAIAGKN